MAEFWADMPWLLVRAVSVEVAVNGFTETPKVSAICATV